MANPQRHPNDIAFEAKMRERKFENQNDFDYIGVRCSMILENYSYNSLQASADDIERALNGGLDDVNYYSFGLMLQLVKGATFKMHGCKSVEDILPYKRRIQKIDEAFNLVVDELNRQVQEEQKPIEVATPPKLTYQKRSGVKGPKKK